MVLLTQKKLLRLAHLADSRQLAVVSLLLRDNSVIAPGRKLEGIWI